MADGTIVLDTRIDTKGADRGYQKLIDSMAKIQRQIQAIDNDSRADTYKRKIEGIAAATEKLEARQRELAGQRSTWEAQMALSPKRTTTELAAIEKEYSRNQKTLEKMGETLLDVQNKQDNFTRGQADKVAALKDRYAQLGMQLEEYNAKQAQIGEAPGIFERFKNKISEVTAKTRESSAAATGASASFERFVKRITGLLKTVFIFNLLRTALNGFRTYLSKAAQTVPELNAALARLKGALLTAFQPLWNVIIPALVKFVQLLTAVAQMLARVIAAAFGKNTKAMANEAKGLYGVAGAADEASKSLLGFDEINQLDTGSKTSDPGIGADFSMDIPETDFAWLKPVEEFLTNIVNILKPTREILKEIWAVVSPIIGSMLETFLGFVNEQLKKLGDWLAEHKDEILDWIDNNKELVAIITLAAIALLLFSGGAGDAGTAILLLVGLLLYCIQHWSEFDDSTKTAIIIIGLVVAAVLLAKAGMGLLVLGIIALIAIVYLLVKNWQNLDDSTKKVVVIVIAAIAIFVVLVAVIGTAGTAALLFVAAIAALVFAFGYLIDKIGGVIDSLTEFKKAKMPDVDDFKKGWSGCDVWFDANVINPLRSKFATLKSDFITLTSEGILELQNLLLPLPQWNTDNVLAILQQTITEFLTGMRQSVADSYSTMLSRTEGAVRAINAALARIERHIVITIEYKTVGAPPSITGGATVSGRIPGLARGAVIPPNERFLAVLGDQRSGTNIETPLSTMIDAFKAAQGEQSFSIEAKGSMAQLIRLLNLQIKKDNKNLGKSLVRSTV